MHTLVRLSQTHLQNDDTLYTRLQWVWVKKKAQWQRKSPKDTKLATTKKELSKKEAEKSFSYVLLLLIEFFSHCLRCCCC